MLIHTEKTKATAAAKAGMDEKTARRYLKHGELPSQCRTEHNWRTRQDPFFPSFPGRAWERGKKGKKKPPSLAGGFCKDQIITIFYNWIKLN